MKRHLALFTAVFLAACGSLYAQDSDSNAELEAWRATLADYNRRADDAQQQYNEAMALWQANFDEATRPMSAGERFLAGLQYVGDKALTGVVNYYSNRAAIRSEMGRFDTRFNALRNEVMGARADILAANNTSTASILAANNASTMSILAANEASTTSILGANETSTATIMGALNASGEVLSRLGTNLNAAIMGNRTAIMDNGTAIMGNNTAIMGNRTAIMDNGTAIGNNGTAIMNNGTAIGNNSTAIMNNGTAIGNNATAIMNNGTAIMNNGTAISANEQLLRDVLSNLQQTCDTPFGQIGQPCRP